MISYWCVAFTILVNPDIIAIFSYRSHPLSSSNLSRNNFALIVGKHPLGGAHFHSATNTFTKRPKDPVGRLLLRLPLFILPPPHPSVKVGIPQGVLSYDKHRNHHDCTFLMMMPFYLFLQKRQPAHRYISIYPLGTFPRG